MPASLPAPRRRARTRQRDNGTCTADGCLLPAHRAGRCHKHRHADVQARTVRRK